MLGTDMGILVFMVHSPVFKTITKGLMVIDDAYATTATVDSMSSMSRPITQRLPTRGCLMEVGLMVMMVC